MMLAPIITTPTVYPHEVLIFFGLFVLGVVVVCKLINFWRDW
jgi:hypothetical protein